MSRRVSAAGSRARQAPAGTTAGGTESRSARRLRRFAASSPRAAGQDDGGADGQWEGRERVRLEVDGAHGRDPRRGPRRAARGRRRGPAACRRRARAPGRRPASASSPLTSPARGPRWATGSRARRTPGEAGVRVRGPDDDDDPVRQPRGRVATARPRTVLSIDRAPPACRRRSGSRRRPARTIASTVTGGIAGGRGRTGLHPRDRPRAEHVAGVGPPQESAPVQVLEDHQDVPAARARRVAI